MEDFADLDVGELLPLKDFLSLPLDGVEDLVPVFREMGNALSRIEQQERQFSSKLKDIGDIVRENSTSSKVNEQYITITARILELEELYRKIEEEKRQQVAARRQASKQVADMYNGIRREPYGPDSPEPSTSSAQQEGEQLEETSSGQ